MKPGKNALLLGLAVAAGAMAAAAQAAVVTQWAYSTDARFTGATFDSGSGSTAFSTYELSWGMDGGSFMNDEGNIHDGDRSALTIGNGVDDTLTGGGPAEGTIDTTMDGMPDTPAEIGVGTSMTHWNNPISSEYATLVSGTLRDTLTLTPLVPAGSDLDAPTIDFEFRFVETINDPPNNGSCAAGTPEPCGDLWGIVSIPTLNVPFTYDSVDYLLSILVLDPNGGVSPIAMLADEQCTELGLAVGCQGFLTPENAATTVEFAFAVSTKPIFVPEPATLLLMGVGVAGIGFAGARRRSR